MLKAQGATFVEIKKFDEKDIGKNEFKVLLMEFKTDLNDYLAIKPGAACRSARSPTSSRSTRRMRRKELALFGQDIFEKAEATKGLDDPDYKKARARSLRARGPDRASTVC